MVICFDIRGKYVSLTDYSIIGEREGDLYMEDYGLMKGLQMCSIGCEESR
jgi:hypothetical protein